MTRNFGKEIEARYAGPTNAGTQMMQRLPGGGHRQMYEFIANLFYFGFKRQLIDCLKELTKICNGQYKMGIQTKLLNTINIILTHNRNAFPVVQLINNYRKNQIQRRKEQKKKSAMAGKQTGVPTKETRESPGFNSHLDDTGMVFGKSNATSLMNDSGILESSNEEHNYKHGANTARQVQNLDPSNLFDPKYIETKKIENL
jgi:hypothetical protein